MSLFIYVIGVLIVVTVMLSSYFLGGRSKIGRKIEPYESGAKAFGTANVRFFAQYFLIAVLFVIFDLESVFLYVWSSSIKALGFRGLFQMLFFIGMLLLALVYAVSLGVLRSPKSMRTRTNHE